MELSENKKTVMRYIEGFRKSDHEMILSCLTEDVVWSMPGAFHHEGKVAFDKEIENEAFVGSPVLEVLRLVEENNTVIAEGTVRAKKREGGIMEALFCDIFDMRDGKIKKLTTYMAFLK